MQVATSSNGLPIRSIEERWQHITTHHPELGNQQEKLLETIATSEQIPAGYGQDIVVKAFLQRNKCKEIPNLI